MNILSSFVCDGHTAPWQPVRSRYLTQINSALAILRQKKRMGGAIFR
jgi:hypothetical protein